MSKASQLTPQKGFQTDFLSSPADILFGGGAAGAGKSFALLLEWPRYTHVNNWTGVIFRRTYGQVTSAGGLWDTAQNIYLSMADPSGDKGLPVKLNSTKLSLEWPNKSRLSFAHLQHEKHKLNWQGSQIGYLGFDELTHFSQSQFFYLLSRNRSATGIKPYTRATLNPQGTGWIKDMISWYLYPDDYPDTALASFPRPDRCGKLRYFTRYKGVFIWGNTKEEVLEHLPANEARLYTFDDIKSFSFIPGSLEDNKKLTQMDPGYRANLLAMAEEETEQLLKGRWIEIKDDSLRLFPYDALRDIFTNDFVKRSPNRYVTADIALEGSDRFVIMVWEGFRVVAIEFLDKSTGKEVLRAIQSAAHRYRVPNSHIIVDADGVGGFLPSFLAGAHSFHNNGRAIPVQGLTQQYRNLKAQCWYGMSRKVKDYEVYIQQDIADKMIDLIMEEIYSMKKVITDNGVLDVIKKSMVAIEIGRSPDFGDAFMMRYYFELVKVVDQSSSALI